MENVELAWSVILGCSLVVLCFLLFKIKLKWRWMSYVLAQMVAAAIILYAINLTDLFGEYRIPINLATVSTIGILGIPGVALLVAMRLILV